MGTGFLWRWLKCLRADSCTKLWTCQTPVKISSTLWSLSFMLSLGKESLPLKILTVPFEKWKVRWLLRKHYVDAHHCCELTAAGATNILLALSVLESHSHGSNQPRIKYIQEGPCDGSVGQRACRKDRRPKFNPLDTDSGKRELTPTSFPLISTYMPWHGHT